MTFWTALDRTLHNISGPLMEIILPLVWDAYQAEMKFSSALSFEAQLQMRMEGMLPLGRMARSLPLMFLLNLVGCWPSRFWLSKQG